MGDEFEDAGYASFHVVHGCAAGVHVAWFGGFAHCAVVVAVAVTAVAVISVYVAIHVRCAAVGCILRTAAGCWRGFMIGVVMRWRVAVFGVLVSADATLASWWSASLFVRCFGGWVVWESGSGESIGRWLVASSTGGTRMRFRGC